MHILSVTETITEDCEFEPHSVLHIIREMEKTLSRLTDAVASISAEVNNLAARIQANEQATNTALAQANADLATAQAEANTAADQLAAIQSQIAAVAAPAAPPAPPADEQPAETPPPTE